MVELILHMGAHRTATTTFQKFLKHNAAVLEEENISAIGADVTRAGLLTGLMCHPDTATAEKDRRAHRAAGLVRLMLAEKTRHQFGQVILSEPDLMGNISENITTGRLYPTAAARFTRMHKAFDSHLSRIVLCIRSYDSWWVSQFAAGIMQGHAMPDLAQMDRLVTQPRRWRMLVEDLNAAFPGAEILVLPYESFGADVARSLGVMTGVVTDGLSPLQQKRHAIAPSTRCLKEIVTDRGERPADNSLEDLGASWNPLPADHTAALQDAYREDLTWLRMQKNKKITLIDDTGREPAWEEDQRGQDDGFEEEYAAARRMGRPSHKGTPRPTA